jgi:hypothetical protein
MTTSKSANSARENIAGPTTGLHPAIYVLVAAVILGSHLLTKTSPQAIAAQLSSHAVRVGFAGGGLLTLLLVVVAFDLRSSSRPTYQPPSSRVRFARSFVIALFLVVAGFAVATGLRPDVPQLVLAQGRVVAILIVPIFGLAIAYDLACLRAPKRIEVPLPTFREAAHALRETNDFLLGITGVEDWKTAGSPHRWFVVPEKAMFTNIFALGGIGSGKTATCLKPMLEQALFKFPTDTTRSLGLFIIDGTKGSLTEYVYERAKLAGRENDVVEIKPGGLWSYNLVAEGNPTALATKLVAALEVMTAQESHSYYKKMQREFAENSFQILTDVLGSGRFTLMDLYNFICDPAVHKQFIEAAAPKNSISYRWFKNQWANEDPREQMQLTKGFRADLSLFVRDELAPTFSNANANFPGWKSFLNDGKIVVFNMDLSTWGELTRALGIFLLMDFQRAMIARSQPSFKRAGGNTERLVLCAIDECWAFINPGLAEFTAVSRESRCCTFGLTQSLGQFPLQYRDTMIGNFRTAIVLPVQDPLTMETYSRLFGTYRATRESVSESTGFSGVEQQLFTDAVRARMGGESRSVSVSTQEVDEPRFSPTDLLHLQANTAAVLMFDGSVVRPSRVVRLLPSYRSENQLFDGGAQ